LDRSLAEDAFVEVLSRKLNVASALLQLLAIFADPQHHLRPLSVLAQPYQLPQSDRMQVLRVVDRNEEDKKILLERPPLQQGVSLLQLSRKFVSLRDKEVFEQQVDEVGKGEDARPAGNDNDATGRSRLELESAASRNADLNRRVNEVYGSEGGGEFAVVVDLEHYRHVVILSLILFFLVQPLPNVLLAFFLEQLGQLSLGLFPEPQGGYLL
jgi:hypothetical protein